MIMRLKTPRPCSHLAAPFQAGGMGGAGYTCRLLSEPCALHRPGPKAECPFAEAASFTASTARTDTPETALRRAAVRLPRR